MTKPENTVRAPLLAVLGKHLRLVADADGIPLTADLADLGLDSMAAVSLLMDLESTFDVTFPDEMLTAETFQSASTLEQAIVTLMGSA